MKAGWILSRGPLLCCWTLALLGLGARVAAYTLHPDIHPDEIFQYVEPAWWHLHGYGWPAWEWDVGLRSWVLPAYHGAWAVILSWLGVRDGRTLFHFLQLQWAVVGLTMVWAGWRAGRILCGAAAGTGRLAAGGKAGWEGGLLAAAAVALLPTIVYFSPHTFSEAPSTILLLWGHTIWLEARAFGNARSGRQGLLTGFLLSLAVCIRIANGPLVLPAVIDLWIRRRWRALTGVVVAGVGVAIAFGIVDWITWGHPFHSAREYIDYNFIQGRAAEHGVSPMGEYVSQFRDRLGFGALVLVVPPLLAFRRVWPFMLGALLLTAMLSSQPHKEERFLLAAYPLLAVSWGAACGLWLARARRRWLRVACWTTVALVGAAVVWRNVRGIQDRPVLDYTRRWGLYESEAWAGRQTDTTGVLVEGPFHLSGGWVLLGKNLPLDSLDAGFLQDPLYNYAVVTAGSSSQSMCEAGGFRIVHTAGTFLAMRR